MVGKLKVHPSSGCHHSLFLPPKGYWCLNPCHPWSFFGFSMAGFSLYLFLFRSTQIGILKRTCKGHLLSVPGCVALHYLRCITFSQCVSSPVAVPWTVRRRIVSGYWVARKAFMEPKKFWCLTFSERGTFVLMECLESGQTPLYPSLLCLFVAVAAFIFQT